MKKSIIFITVAVVVSAILMTGCISKRKSSESGKVQASGEAAGISGTSGTSENAPASAAVSENSGAGEKSENPGANEVITEQAANFAEWAGCRRSSYGFRPYKPSVKDFTDYVDTMSSFFKKNETENATGALIWIVGEVSSKNSISCRLNFPKPSGMTIPRWLGFSKEDFNEEYLTAFDKAGYDVWLQVEPGYVDIEQLAVIVMTQYKHHPCVKGFGIDVEWYQNTTDGEDGTPLNDETAEKVDRAIKKINPAYSVFVKHWDQDFLPPEYRGVNNDMIFVTDSQYFYSFKEMTEHYTGWAEYYAPNPVFFQIGYEGEKKNRKDPNEIGSDEKLWRTFDKPLQGLGQFILDGLSQSTVEEVKIQKKGIIWVDFTLLKAYNMSNSH